MNLTITGPRIFISTADIVQLEDCHPDSASRLIRRLRASKTAKVTFEAYAAYRGVQLQKVLDKLEIPYTIKS